MYFEELSRLLTLHKAPEIISWFCCQALGRARDRGMEGERWWIGLELRIN